MTWRIHRKKTKSSNHDLLLVLRCGNAGLGDSQELPPEREHAVSIDAAGAFQQFSGIHHVGRANRVDEDLRALACQPSGGTCMIKVNVGKKHVRYVGGRQVVGCETGPE
jgi:hypothetical protein